MVAFKLNVKENILVDILQGCLEASIQMKDSFSSCHCHLKILVTLVFTVALTTTTDRQQHPRPQHKSAAGV